MEFLRNCQPLSKKSPEDLTNIIPEVIKIFVTSNDTEIEKEALKILKNSCALGSAYQIQLATHDELIAKIKRQDQISNSYLQFLANICVQNPASQQIVFSHFQDSITSALREPELSNASSMIIHQMLLSRIVDSAIVPHAVDNILCHVSSDGVVSDFGLLTLEYVLTEYPDACDVYMKLENRLKFLHFVVDFVQNEENSTINSKLFRRLTMEFKRKSDAILKPDGSGAKTDPKEVYALLELVAYGTCNPKYSHILHEDASLFINLGCLLLAVQKIGKSESIFTPVQRLEQIAPNAEGDSSIEQDISYSLKSLVVKSLGNLLYRNKKNQELVREMNILMAILDCTNIDARNPLIKEYGILAIRNACEDNVENQKIIASLTKIADVQSPITTELTENVIRVKPQQ